MQAFCECFLGVINYVHHCTYHRLVSTPQGANIGTEAVLLAKLYPWVRIIAVESDPAVLEFLVEAFVLILLHVS